MNRLKYTRAYLVQVGQRIILQYALIMFMVTLSSSVLLAQNCFEIEANNSGVTWYEGSGLERRACDLKTQLALPSFKVLGADLYPVLAYANEADGFNHAFEIMRGQLQSHAGYIFFGRENRCDGTLGHKIDIKYPTHPVFDAWDGVLKDAVRNQLLAILNEVTTGVLSTQGEENALDRFMDIIENGLEGDVFEAAGFQPLLLSAEVNLSRTGDYTTANNGTVTVKNFGGYKLDDIDLGSHMSGGSHPALLQSVSFTVYLSGRENQENSVEFNDIKNQFESDLSEVKLWFHFDFETEIVVGVTGSGSPNRFQSSNTPKPVYIISDNNLSEQKAQECLDDKFEEYWSESTHVEPGETLEYEEGNANCTDLNWQYGKTCIYNSAHLLPFSDTDVGQYITAHAAFMGGVLDGFLGTIRFIYEISDPIASFAKNALNDALEMSASDWFEMTGLGVLYGIIFKESYRRQLGEDWDQTQEFLKSVWNGASDVYDLLFPNGILAEGAFKELGMKLWTEFIRYVGGQFHGSITDILAYGCGILAFEIFLEAITFGGAGAAKGAQYLERGAKIAASIGDSIKGFSSFANTSRRMSTRAAVHADELNVAHRCAIIGRGCFVKGTPVLMANKNYNNPFIVNVRNAAAVVATVIATPLVAVPIIAMPIQDVQLLDYAVAHKTVNNYEEKVADHLLASTDEIYTGLINEKSLIKNDPYTSDQQRRRDQYEINDTDWNEVVFVEVNGSSTAKLALHNDWIGQNGYKENTVVNLDLPEQGISGPFRITSMKHIIPQKKPVDDDESDDYDYRPVTALFTHESDQVYNIDFDNGEQLGVTYQHPIYSVSEGDWRLAGELEVGESVLTKSGEATITKSEKKEGSETVYNLEVKELHNFLVGESGVVVHNSCWSEYLDFIFKPIFSRWTRRNVPGKRWVSYIDESGIPDAKEIKQLEDLGEKIQKKMIGLEKSPNNGAPFPGVDGLIEGGNPLSLKKAETASSGGGLMSEMVQKANNLNDGNVLDHGDMKGMFSKIDGMLTADKSDKWWLKERWLDKLNNSNLNTDIIDKFYVEAKDGWMMWDSKTGLWTDLL